MKQARSIFQLLLERTARYLPLQDTVAEVSRYAMKNFERQWEQFILEHPNHPNEVLKILAQDENWGVRWVVARRKQDLPEDLLRILAQDEKWVIRREVADRKQDLPDKVLRILAQDEHWGVRSRVVERKQDLSHEVLKSLAQDEEEIVRRAFKARKGYCLSRRGVSL